MAESLRTTHLFHFSAQPVRPSMYGSCDMGFHARSCGLAPPAYAACAETLIPHDLSGIPAGGQRQGSPAWPSPRLRPGHSAQCRSSPSVPRATRLHVTDASVTRSHVTAPGNSFYGRERP